MVKSDGIDEYPVMLIRLLLTLVICVRLGACLTCYDCSDHGHGHQLECIPRVCIQGQVCGIQLKKHDAHKLHIEIPIGCKQASYCDVDKCCKDDVCVDKVMAAAHVPFIHHVPLTTTTHNAPTTTLVPPTTRPPYNCQDRVVSLMSNCPSLVSSGVCSSQSGVQLCQKTCGFCDYVESHFGDRGPCQDLLMNNECDARKHLNSDICKNPLALNMCPYTCGLCEKKMLNVITEFLTRTTTVTIATTTTSCEDSVEDNGCASVPNVCRGDIGRSVCPRFCGLCDTTKIMKTIVPTTRTTSRTTTVTTTTTKPTASKTTTTTTTTPTTTITPKGLPTLTRTTANALQCVDELKNNGCKLLPYDICQQNMAQTICPRFCNLCGQI